MASSGNFCVMNPLNWDVMTFSHGNLRISTTSNYKAIYGTMAIPSSGKWYWEVHMKDYANGGVWIGGGNDVYKGDNESVMQYGFNSGTYSGETQSQGSTITGYGNQGAHFGADGDVFSYAVDVDNQKFYVARNNTYYNSGNPSTGSNGADISSAFSNKVSEIHPVLTRGGSYNEVYHFNFGQDSTFGGDKTAGGNVDASGFGDFFYPVPTSFKALCSGNLPISDDIDPAQTDDNFNSKNFGVVLFDGNGTTNAVTGLGFKPDLIWGFTRSGGQSKRLVDSTRGGSSRLYSDSTSSESTGTATISSFDSDGFTATGGAFNNDSGKTCGAWCWKANGGSTISDSSGDITVIRQTNDVAKFSILTYTGNGSSGSTIAHGLGVKPAMTIIKQRNSSNGWNVWHQGNNNGDYDSFGELNGSASWYQNQGSNGAYTTDPTNSLLTLSAYGQVNGSGNTYVAYVWADVEGMQRFSAYTGNGQTGDDAPFIYTGFRPRIIFFKNISGSSGWTVVDTETYPNNTGNGPERIEWNSSSASVTGSSASRNMDILSNGVKIRSSNSNINTNGSTYIFGSWGDQSFKYSNAR